MTTPDDKYYNDHAALLGLVSLAWNDCHSMVLNIFHTVSGMSWTKAQAAFLAIKADQAQRDMTIALLNAVLATENDSRMLELGTSLLGKLGGLAGERNLAAHTMWITTLPDRKIVPHPGIMKPKLLREDFETQFSELTTKLRDLFRRLLEYHAALRVHLEQRKAGH
jgi:hypothetical protein